MTRNKSAFTIIELIVSFSVIALIIGLLTSGFYIKRKAELNLIFEKFAILQSAYSNFESVYNSPPGDLFAYSPPAFGANGSTVSGVTVKYGNGNGIIDNTPSSEGIIALQHLSFANLIPSIYSGSTSTVSSATNWFYRLGSDSTRGYYFGSNSNTPGSNFSVFDSNSNDSRSAMIIYAKMSDNALATLSAISASDIYKLDLKYDDGFPKTGNILAAGGSDNVTGCINTATTPNSYKSSSYSSCYIGAIINKKAR